MSLTDTTERINKPIPDLDAEIQTIEHQDCTKENGKQYYYVDVSLFKTLDEANKFMFKVGEQ